MAIKDDDEKSNEEKTNSSDENFGLPDLELKPLEGAATRTEGSSGQSTPAADAGGSGTSSPGDYGVEEPKSKAPLILTIVIVLVVAITGYLIYNFVYKPRAEEKAKKEQLARQEVARRKAEEERLAKEKAAAEEQQRREAELANAKPAIGTIEVLNARTRRYYVIICSDVDDDLLMDYAKKLTSTGVSLKVIPPFGGKQFTRLAVADHDTFALAQASADASKGTYGAGVWVLKY